MLHPQALTCRTLCACVLATVMLVPAHLVAQEADTSSIVEMTREQLELNNAASMALNQDQPDAELAARKLEEALKKGPGVDILYMSLGRAYQLRDQCESATETFQLARNAPSIEQVPHKVVLEKIDRYEREKAVLCSGTVTFRCKDIDARIVVAEQELLCGQTGTLTPGNHDAMLFRDEELVDQISVLVMGSRNNTVDLSGKLTRPAPMNVVEQPLPTGKGLLWGGGSAAVLGAAALAGGYVTAIRLDEALTARELKREQADMKRLQRNALYISGGTLLGAGLVAMTFGLMRRRAYEDARTLRITPDLVVTARGSSLSLTFEF